MSQDPMVSFHAFQRRMLHEYETMIESYGLMRLDANLPVKLQQRLLREAVERTLPEEDYAGQE